MKPVVSSQPQLVYLVYGKSTYHDEAVFSIASALAMARQLPDADFGIIVLTDEASHYRHLPVNLRLIDSATLERWSGPHRYHFRGKHLALRQVLAEFETAALVDTDTFFKEPAQRLFERIGPGKLLCNAVMQPFGASKEAPLYRLLAQKLEQAGIADDQLPLLNSGVIGLNAQDAQLLERSVQLMDELFPEAQGAYTLEEFCLSLVAYRGLDVQGCTDLIHHYWSRKQLFRAKAQAWLAKHRHAPLSAMAMADTARVTPELPRPPALQRTLNKLVTLTMPAQQRQFIRELLYGCYHHRNEFDRACASAWWDKALSNVQARLAGAFNSRLLEAWLDQPTTRVILGRHWRNIRQHLLQHVTGTPTRALKHG